MIRMTLLLMTYLLSSSIFAASGLISLQSNHGVTATADRLETVLLEKGMTVFARINHDEAAWKIKKKLRPTQLVIFGNPKIGTLLMQCQQTAAIDLPQKALIWEDEKGRVWLSYNAPEYIASRHDIKECVEVTEKIEKALANFAHAATSN